MNIEQTINILIDKLENDSLTIDEHKAIISNESINYNLLNYIIVSKKNNNKYLEENIVRSLILKRIETNAIFKSQLIAIAVLYKFLDILEKINYKENKEDYENSLSFFDNLNEIRFLLDLKNKDLNTFVYKYFLNLNYEISKVVKNEFSLDENMLFNDFVKKYDFDYYQKILENKKGIYTYKDLCENKDLFIDNLKNIEKYKTIEQIEIYKSHIELIINEKNIYENLDKELIFEALYLTDKKINQGKVERIIKEENNIRNEHVCYRYETYNGNLLNILNIEKIKDVELAIKFTFKNRKADRLLENILNKHKIEQKKLIKLIQEIQKSELTKYDSHLKLLVGLVEDKENISNVLINNMAVAVSYLKDININRNNATKICSYIFQSDNIESEIGQYLIQTSIEKNININWSKVFEDMYKEPVDIIKFAIEHDKNILKIDYLENFCDNIELLKCFFNKKDFKLKESYIEVENKYIKEKRLKVFDFYKNFNNIKNF